MEVGSVPRRRGVAFVSTVRPTPRQRRTARLVAGLSVLMFFLTAPFAKEPLREVPAFLPIYESALVVFDLITCMLLFGQYRMLRGRALLCLATGYLFSALLAIAHALSFPGLFAPTGALGAGPQTTAWLYFLWHAGFPVFILGYTLWPTDDPHVPAAVVAPEIRRSLVTGAAIAVMCVLVTTALHDQLPSIMRGHVDAPSKLAVAAATWMVGLAALLRLWQRRAQTVLDLWLMVVLCVWLADTALAAVLNHARFDVGWYAGRLYGLCANGFVLAVLLLESGSLYERVARSNRLLEHALGETRRLNGDLQAFAGSLAHDLQQPLVAIRMHAQVIEQQPLPDDGQQHVRHILGASDTAREMIRALLEFARLGESPLRLDAVDLDEVVAQARATVTSDGRAAAVRWQVGPLPVVEGDRPLLLLAFVNLLSNAVKYSREQAQPTVTIDAVPGPEGQAVIRVRDNGVGFSMAGAGRLFAPFERLHDASRFEGTGMGLANVRRIVERHRGRISAQSAPGEGATFSVTLREYAPRRDGVAVAAA